MKMKRRRRTVKGRERNVRGKVMMIRARKISRIQIMIPALKDLKKTLQLLRKKGEDDQMITLMTIVMGENSNSKRGKGDIRWMRT